MDRSPTDSQYLSNGLIGNPYSSKCESSTDIRLPQDAINEILLRLPVSSLVKFKCVSKPWPSLISSPQFIKSHFSTSSKEGRFLNHHLVFTTSESGIIHCPFHLAFDDSFKMKIPSGKPDGFTGIAGVVNGLVCLAIGENDLYLLNPNLGQSNCLPSSNLSLKDCTFVAYGFGYDESKDDYKVVKAVSVCRGGVYETKVEVYSLRADSWRILEDFKVEVPTYYNTGKYANGKIYWTAFGRRIVSLDMLSEEYDVVEGPDYEAGVDNWRIGIFGGRLSVFCEYKTTKADLWVMDKDGAEESWSKTLSIPYDDVVHPTRSIEQVLCILGNGDIVLEGDSGLITYNSKTKVLRDFPLVDYLNSEVFLYVESLVSPTN